MRQLFRLAAPPALALMLTLGGGVSAAPEPQKQTAQQKQPVKILATGGTTSPEPASPAATATRRGRSRSRISIKAVPDPEARAAERRAGGQHRQPGHERPGVAQARQPRERGARFTGHERRRDHHGTDTLEETAYFLNLVIKSDKPVVLVGSMRPATAISPDGPANLYNGVAVAADPGSKGRGALVVLNDEVHAARNVIKTNTTSLQTFESANRGPVGFVHTGKIAWFERMDKRHTTKSEFSVKDRRTCRAWTSSTRTRT